MRILMAASELHPLAKVGGLADMVASLSRALRAMGHEVRCALPRYPVVERKLGELGAREAWRGEVSWSVPGGREHAGLTRVEGDSLPAPLLLVSHECFRRDGIYADPETGRDRPDDGARWACFCRAVFEAMASGIVEADVVHAHDHQAAALPGLLRFRKRGRPSRRPPTVFTLHNVGYQGIEDPSWLDLVGLPSALFYPGGPAEFYGRVNRMKIGIEAADRLTTVSPTHAREILEDGGPGFGLEGVLRARAAVLTGILNGIDTDQWDPSVDRHIPFPYNRNALEGKAKNRIALLREIGLRAPSPPVPLVAMVGRLAAQKGLDILLPALERLLSDGVQMVVLGSGEDRYREAFRAAAMRHPDRLAVRLGFDEGLAHRIEAGADIFLMPSRYEPCGLNQMYSLRYGTVPVVHAVGGLEDTVVDVDEDPENGNGFKFRRYESAELLMTMRRATRAWSRKKLWRELVRRGMAADFSWVRSARRYLEVYEAAARVPQAEG